MPEANSEITSLSFFDYELPANLIAQAPASPRDSARLLDASMISLPVDRLVSDLPDLFGPNDCLVVNETRVMAARVHCTKPTGADSEVLVLEPLDDGFSALVRNSRKIPVGTRLLTGEAGIEIEVAERLTGDTRRVRVLSGGLRLSEGQTFETLERIGVVPLPPYISQPLQDPERYQTVYSTLPRSAAAPTAGLHLTSDLLERIQNRGVRLAAVELVVGLDTFRPVVELNPLDHKMHSESYRISEQSWEAVLATKRAGGRVWAIGTTTTRALETAAKTGQLSGRTQIFIYRGFDFELVDLLLTNFHMPRSTLLMMIDAFVGPQWRQLYEQAKFWNYRFLSFGDAMLLRRNEDRVG